MGIRPWEWERIQPVDLFELEEAARWNRDREWERQALVAAMVMPRPDPHTTFREVYENAVSSLPGYQREE